MGEIVAASAGRMTYKADFPHLRSKTRGILYLRKKTKADLLQLAAKLLARAANAENVPLRAVRVQTRPAKRPKWAESLPRRRAE